MATKIPMTSIKEKLEKKHPPALNHWWCFVIQLPGQGSLATAWKVFTRVKVLLKKCHLFTSGLLQGNNTNLFSRDYMFSLNKYIHMLCHFTATLFCRHEVTFFSNSFIHQEKSVCGWCFWRINNWMLCA